MSITHVIYADRAQHRGGPPRPTPVAVVSQPCLTPAFAVSAADASLIAVLDGAALPGETIELAFRRKEHELLARFAALAVDDAIALHRRLASPREDDALAQAFSRLLAARRDRLLAFLADARRRVAVASVKGGRRG